MTDIFTKEKRSSVMSLIRGKNTKPEIKVRKLLFSKGLRFRLHDRRLPGKPDIVLKRYRIAIFVNGCFWHNHNCRKNTKPNSNSEFWSNKLKQNVDRQKQVVIALKKLGWNTFILWECNINKSSYNDNMFPTRMLHIVAEKGIIASRKN